MDSELLQSFVRSGPTLEEEIEPSRLYNAQQKEKIETPSTPTRTWGRRKNVVIIEQRKVKTVALAIDECYCDKDRAAAVSFGYVDIKYDLKQKQSAEKLKVRIMPDDSDAMAFLMLGMREIKCGNIESGLRFLSKAIEMSPNDQGALIARSKCYLQLGEPEKALTDAETALSMDKNSIRAIFQKAESLYYLGRFEFSLMFFYRGLRLRPELDNFRLGVQKSQEAIEATIGGCQKKVDQRALTNLQTTGKFSSNEASKVNKTKLKPSAKEICERKQSRKLLGELFVDKEYLENLLAHPNLKRADTKNEDISTYATEAIDFLNAREEFWRQQNPTNILASKKSNSVIASLL
ncbi:CLUMA_CG021002, isoform A [Clunio marinus]|uniref:Outer dynein arm-docking complex subunit 4 n=1 Tax=Clunio marinus TaxID=568069 RepID=A0A1J1J814_9DIPT|nr:CLUMA_CG021002, isoform A [Clunio marinus]